jgi:hypothetical protein
MTRTMGQCDVCINRYQNKKGYYCEAFPDGIPEELYSFGIPHTKPYKGDNGIQFKQDPAQPILEE